MIRTIEEIRQRKSEGKKKWGKDLLEFLNPYFDAGRTYDEIVLILDKNYNIQIDSVSLRNLKSKHSKNKGIITAEIVPQYTKDVFRGGQIREEKEIVQNQDSKNTDIENLFNSFLGDENIIEKQKRERDELFKTNSKGAKW